MGARLKRTGETAAALMAKYDALSLIEKLERRYRAGYRDGWIAALLALRDGSLSADGAWNFWERELKKWEGAGGGLALPPRPSVKGASR